MTSSSQTHFFIHRQSKEIHVRPVDYGWILTQHGEEHAFHDTADLKDYLPFDPFAEIYNFGKKRNPFKIKVQIDLELGGEFCLCGHETKQHKEHECRGGSHHKCHCPWRFEKPILCSNCGSLNRSSAKACSQCGNQFFTEKDAPVDEEE